MVLRISLISNKAFLRHPPDVWRFVLAARSRYRATDFNEMIRGHIIFYYYIFIHVFFSPQYFYNKNEKHLNDFHKYKRVLFSRV